MSSGISFQVFNVLTSFSDVFLSCDVFLFYSFLLQLDFELTAGIPAKKLNSQGTCFLFEFVWLKRLVTKQKLGTKFVTFYSKIAQYDLNQYF